eukprot:EG_transcript_8199
MIAMVDCTAACPAVYDLHAPPTAEGLADLPETVPACQGSVAESPSNDATTTSATDSTLGPASSTGHRDSYESAISADPATALPAKGAVFQPKDDRAFLRSASVVVGRGMKGMGKGFRMLSRGLSLSKPKAKSKPAPGTALEALARKAERRLQRLPEGERAALEPLRDAMLSAVHGRDLTPEIAAHVRALAVGQRLKEAEAAAGQFCDVLRRNTDVAAATGELMLAARGSGDQLLELLRDHLTAVGQRLRARDTAADLLPARGCRLQLEGLTLSDDVYHTASALCALQIVALLRLRRTLAAYCDFAAHLVERARRMEAEDPAMRAVAAAARATKRDICLLAGTCTNLMMEPFYQLLPLVQCATLPPKK